MATSGWFLHPHCQPPRAGCGVLEPLDAALGGEGGAHLLLGLDPGTAAKRGPPTRRRPALTSSPVGICSCGRLVCLPSLVVGRCSVCQGEPQGILGGASALTSAWTAPEGKAPCCPPWPRGPATAWTQGQHLPSPGHCCWATHRKFRVANFCVVTRGVPEGASLSVMEGVPLLSLGTPLGVTLAVSGVAPPRAMGSSSFPSCLCGTNGKVWFPG